MFWNTCKWYGLGDISHLEVVQQVQGEKNQEKGRCLHHLTLTQQKF
jgi:hypothetical protein